MITYVPIGFFGGSLGPGELALVFIVALMLFGSRNLPKVARTIGKALEEFRKAAREVSNEIMRGEHEPSARHESRPDSHGEPDDEDPTTR